MGNNNSTNPNYRCDNSAELSYTNETINNDDIVKCSTLIGYSYNRFVPILFLIISIIGLILNLLLIRDYIKKKSKNQSRKQSSMKKLFAVFPFLDCITSIYWIISSSIFRNAGIIANHVLPCRILSIIYFSIFTFEFIFINFILIHFRKISLNPMEGILKPSRNIKKYLSISIILTLLIVITTIFLHVFGRSPMNTCFLNTDNDRGGLIFLIPFASTLLIIIQVIIDLKCREMFLNDKQVRDAYKLNSMYILVFSLLHFPFFLLIIITSAKDSPIKRDETILINYTYFCTLLTCSIPMIIGILRNCKGFGKQIKEKLMKKNTIDQINGNLTNETLIPEDQFDWLEKHSMKFFMRDILIAIAHCIYSSKSYGRNIYLTDLNKENETFTKFNIGFDTFKLDDETVSQYLNIKVIEYAPKIFAYLRNLEEINVEKMANSFLPKKNKKGISESQGKSGSFFISTDDNQYMVKTLRVDEFDLIRSTFLNKYVEYLTKNKSSLLCRIYGMYNITTSQGDEILVIVMRNVIGDFKNNIVAEYDLKGSHKNRKLKFDDISKATVMKDINFDTTEYGIMINRNDIKRLRKLTRYDSLFLRQLELMDYSLFLVKITLSKEEIDDLFGEEVREKQEKDFNDLMMKESLQPSLVLNENGKSLKINLNEIDYTKEIKPKKSIKEKGKIFRHNKHYKQHIYLSITPGTAYILAIIDYFQYFNFYKYIESGLKTRFGKKDKKQVVSCVDPKTYSERFINYIVKLTEIKKILSVDQSKDNDTNKSDSNNEIEEVEEDNITNTSENCKLNVELKHI